MVHDGKETHQVNTGSLQLSAWGHFPSHMQSVEFKQNTVVLLSKGWRLVQSPRLWKHLESVGKALERGKGLGRGFPKSVTKGWAG